MGEMRKVPECGVIVLFILFGISVGISDGNRWN